MIVFVLLLVGGIRPLSAAMSTASMSTTTGTRFAVTSASTQPTPSHKTGPTTHYTIDHEECDIAEVNGYLHLHCGWSNWNNPTGGVDERPKYRCPFSNQLYSVAVVSGSILTEYRHFAGCSRVVYSSLCPSDPGFYQACGHFGCSGYGSIGKII